MERNDLLLFPPLGGKEGVGNRRKEDTIGKLFSALSGKKGDNSFASRNHQTALGKGLRTDVAHRGNQIIAFVCPTLATDLSVMHCISVASRRRRSRALPAKKSGVYLVISPFLLSFFFLSIQLDHHHSPFVQSFHQQFFPLPP